MIAKSGFELDRTLASIRRLLGLERSLTLVCARLAIETPELEAKLYAGACVHDHAVAAKMWDDRLRELAAEPELSPGDFGAYFGTPTTVSRLRNYQEFGLNLLNDAYCRYREETLDVLDAPSARIIETRLVGLQRQQVELTEILGTIAKNGLGAAAFSINSDDYRAPVEPSRDPRFMSDRPLVDPMDPSLTVAEQAIQLMHTNLTDLELSTIEICCRFILENRALGWEFALDMARQSWDESRHATAFHNRIVELGGKLGDRQTNLAHWTMTYGQHLPVALSVHQMIGEWIGVDGALWFADYFRERGDLKTAAVFEFVARDECTHVAFGNKWINWLLPDPADRKKALADAEAIRNSNGKTTTGPLTFPFNRLVCEACGYSAEAIDKLEERYHEFGSKIEQRKAQADSVHVEFEQSDLKKALRS